MRVWFENFPLSYVWAEDRNTVLGTTLVASLHFESLAGVKSEGSKTCFSFRARQSLSPDFIGFIVGSYPIDATIL